MTRKKWNRLRRQRPELFELFAKTSWESIIHDKVEKAVKRYSLSQCIQILTVFNVTRKLEQ